MARGRASERAVLNNIKVFVSSVTLQILPAYAVPYQSTNIELAAPQSQTPRARSLSARPEARPTQVSAHTSRHPFETGIITFSQSVSHGPTPRSPRLYISLYTHTCRSRPAARALGHVDAPESFVGLIWVRPSDASTVNST